MLSKKAKELVDRGEQVMGIKTVIENISPSKDVIFSHGSITDESGTKLVPFSSAHKGDYYECTLNPYNDVLKGSMVILYPTMSVAQAGIGYTAYIPRDRRKAVEIYKNNVLIGNIEECSNKLHPNIGAVVDACIMIHASIHEQFKKNDLV